MTTTAKAPKATTRKFVKPDFVNEPLSTLFSTRIRLNEDERAKLKAAYNEQYNSSIPTKLPNIGGSSVSVETSYGSSKELDLRLGMNRICAVDIIQSRDTVALPIILKFQKVLGIQIITAERLEAAFKNYINFVFAD